MPDNSKLTTKTTENVWKGFTMSQLCFVSLLVDWDACFTYTREEIKV